MQVAVPCVKQISVLALPITCEPGGGQSRQPAGCIRRYRPLRGVEAMCRAQGRKPSSASYDAIVIGGGLAGLSCSRMLEEHGVNYVLVES